MKPQISYSCYSHIGNLRKANQDNFICNGIHENPNPCLMPSPLTGTVEAKATPLFGVFDGLGGEECGEIASFLAAKEAASFPFTPNPTVAFSNYCAKANQTICSYGAQNGILAMGTTAAMILFAPKFMTLCNIGDSKIFRIRQNQLEQLSTDHLALAPFGRKAPLSQNLGIPPELLTIEPYITQLEYQYQDQFLICSDGITDMLSSEMIFSIMQKSPVEYAATNLIAEALKNGGRDNATAIVLKIEKRENKLFPFFRKR